MSNDKFSFYHETYKERQKIELEIESFCLDLLAEGRSWALIIDTTLFKFHTGKGCLNSEEIIYIALETCLNTHRGK